MGKPTQGNQKGAQRHAEGQHGDKTLEALEQINNSDAAHEAAAANKAQRAVNDPNRDGKRGEIAGEQHEQMLERGGDGRHRLFENREQFDEAEMHSEKTRLSRDANRHEHDRENFQIEGGAESHPRG
jgi:hypothetical protein